MLHVTPSEGLRLRRSRGRVLVVCVSDDNCNGNLLGPSPYGRPPRHFVEDDCIARAVSAFVGYISKRMSLPATFTTTLYLRDDETPTGIDLSSLVIVDQL